MLCGSASFQALALMVAMLSWVASPRISTDQSFVGSLVVVAKHVAIFKVVADQKQHRLPNRAGNVFRRDVASDVGNFDCVPPIDD
jgi:hypothetical protein